MKEIQEINIHFDNLSKQKKQDQCPVSKASNEIMLERVCNGPKREFPFTNNICLTNNSQLDEF